MRKLLIVLVAIIFIPFTVKAATPNVKTLEATIEGTTITYTGIMEDGSYAVMCKLLDKDSNELDMLSSAVYSNGFSDTFTVESAGDYKVSCANYEGGEVKTVDVTTKEETKKETAAPVPTSDNIKTYIMIAIVSIFVIAGATIYLKKRVKNN